MKTKIINVNLKTRDEVLRSIAQESQKDKISQKQDVVFKKLKQREEQFTTGFQDGLSIPHARDKSILSPIIYIVRNKQKVDWQSMDKKPVDVSIAILLPDDTKAGDIHMDILQNISKYLMNNKKTTLFKTGTLAKINQEIFAQAKNKPKQANNKKGYDFVAVTSCPTGVAHTNMAAEALITFAKENNLNIKVERQGAQGFVDKLSSEDVKNAKLVIIATARQIDEKERFSGKKVYETGVAAPIKSAKDVYDKAKAKGKVLAVSSRRETAKKAFGSGGATPMQALMSGVSYMIPFVIVGGILIALALGIGGRVVTGQGLQVEPNSFWDAMLNVGVGGFTLMIPILAGFIAAAIGGRSALAPAMIIGFIVGNQDGQLFNWELMQFGGFQNSAKLGFIGAIAVGILIGYLVLAWNKKVSPKFPKKIKAIEPIIVVPLLMVFVSWILFSFFLYLPLFYISFGLEKGITYLLDNNLFFIAAIILGGMVAFDMGGPVNKIAFLLAGGLITAGKPEVMGAIAAAIAVPPLGVGLAVFSGRLFGVKYDKTDQGNAVSAIFMAMIGITEGAIPFAVKYPKQVIISNVIGGAVAATISALFLITDNAQHGGPIMYVLGAIGKDGITNYVWGLLFLMAIIVGSLVTATLMNVLLKIKDKRYVKKSKIN